VRFSDASGLPGLHDAAEVANPHGMSVKFHLPNARKADIVANSLKFFTVATGRIFAICNLPRRQALRRAKVATIRAFLKSHPSVEKANARLARPTVT